MFVEKLNSGKVVLLFLLIARRTLIVSIADGLIIVTRTSGTRLVVFARAGQRACSRSPARALTARLDAHKHRLDAAIELGVKLCDELLRVRRGVVGVGVRSVGKALRPRLGITDDRANIAQHSGAVDSAAQRGHGRGQRVARPLPLPRARSSPDEGGELGLLAVQGVAQLMHLPRRCCHRVGVAQRRHGWDVGCAQASALRRVQQQQRLPWM